MKTKKFIFALIAVVMATALIFALSACGSKDPDDNIVVPPTDGEETVTVSSEMARSYLIGVNPITANTVIDWEDSLGNEKTYGLYNNYYYEEVASAESSVVTQVAKDAAGNAYLVIGSGSGGFVRSRFNTLQSWEFEVLFEEYKAVFSGFSDGLNSAIEAYAEEVAREYGSASSRSTPSLDSSYGTVSYAGERRSDGSISLTINSYALSDGVPCSYRLNVEIGADNYVSRITATVSVEDDYVSSAYDNEDVTIEINYTYNVMRSFTGVGSATSDDLDGNASVTLIVANGGKMPAGFNASVRAGEVVTLPDPTLEGVLDVNTGNVNAVNVEFLGWYYDRELTQPVEDGQFNVSFTSRTQYIYPKWNLTSPTPVLNGGVLSDEETAKLATCYVYSDYDLVTPTKEGYAFVGWYADAALTKPVSSYYNVVNHEASLYAKYEKLVKISFETNSDYLLPSVEGRAGRSVDLPQAIKRGYFFEGWYLDEALTTPASDVFPASDATYYAKFSDGVSVQVVMYDGFVYRDFAKFVTVPAGGDLSTLKSVLNALITEKYLYNGDLIFDHWASDQTGAAISAYPAAEATVYAVYSTPTVLTVNVEDSGLGYDVAPFEWEEYLQGYTIVYDGYYAFLSEVVAERVNDMLGHSVPTQWEMQFYSDADFTRRITEDSAFPSGATASVYVKFAAGDGFVLELGDGSCIEYDLTISSMNERNLTPRELFTQYRILPYADGGVSVVSITAPDGKYFEGWYTDEARTVRFTDYDTVPTAGVTLYAKYADITYITLANGDDYGDYSLNFRGNAAEAISIDTCLSQISRMGYADFADYFNKEIVNYVYATDENGLQHYSAEYYTDSACTQEFVPSSEFYAGTVYLKWGN